MSNKTEHTNNAEQFEKLLKEAFLDLDLDDPKNEEMIDALSASVMVPVAIQHSKPSSSFKQFIGKISLQSVLLVILGIASLIIALKVCNNTVSEKKAVNEQKTVAITTKSSAGIIKEGLEETITDKKETLIPSHQQPTTQTQHQFQSQPNTNIAISAGKNDTSTNIPATIKNDSKSIESIVSIPSDTVKSSEPAPFGFPQFTDEDMKANIKQKKKMMDQLVKRSKPNYSLIPNGKLIYNGGVRLMGDFYMQGHEVTNSEYRTFLFDLLFAKKKEEYLKAKPKDAQWLNCNGTHTFDGLKNEYFSNKAFDDYPVVNITAEAARMYCMWLDKLMEDNREDGTFEFYIDLPRESEWIYCAKGGFSAGSYPWGTDFIQNNYNNFLANFNVQQLQDDFNQPYSYRTKISPTAFTSAGLATNTDTMATASVLAYNPNAYGLYCMSGNVAEWVLSEDGQTTKALGGSWGSDFQHLKIGTESEYHGIASSPFIGFRILVLVKRNQK